MKIAIIIGTAIVLCGISFVLLVRDCRKNIEDFEIKNKGFLIYSVIMCAATVGISVVFATIYTDNELLFSLKRIALLSIMWPVAYTDKMSYRIPNAFIIFGLVCRGLILVAELVVYGWNIWPTLLMEVIAAVALVVAALLCSLVIKNSIGFGDIKLFFVMGLMQGLDGVWSSIFLSLIFSFIISVVLLAKKKKTRKDVIPFGPAIVAGTFLSICLTGM